MTLLFAFILLFPLCILSDDRKPREFTTKN